MFDFCTKYVSFEHFIQLSNSPTNRLFSLLTKFWENTALFARFMRISLEPNQIFFHYPLRHVELQWWAATFNTLTQHFSVRRTWAFRCTLAGVWSVSSLVNSRRLSGRKVAEHQRDQMPSVKKPKTLCVRSRGTTRMTWCQTVTRKKKMSTPHPTSSDWRQLQESGSFSEPDLSFSAQHELPA